MKTDCIKSFRSFVDNELEPAIKELEGIKDKSRKHIQKLMYTNLVDRFDSLVDGMLLDNCREEMLITDAFSKLTQPVTEAKLLELLLKGDDLQDALTNQLKDALRLSVLRQRHSAKLAKLFSVMGVTDDVMRKPRVNPSSGRIITKITPQKVHRNPHSICGYADWLYSRRNAIVHGDGGSAFLRNDVVQTKKLFKVTLSKTFKLSIASINTACAFYGDVCDMLVLE